MASFFDKYINTIDNFDTIKYTGKVTSVNEMTIESFGPRAVLGEICSIKVASKNSSIMAEVVGVQQDKIKLMPYSSTEGIEIGDAVIASGSILKVPVGYGLLGRVLDATGKPIDGKGEMNPEDWYPVMADAPNPMKRRPNTKRITTGIRAIDSLLTVAKGQRLGIFAGSGIGKSTLIGMIARNTNADINVIGLIGERGRELNDFIQRDLGEEGLKRSVIVVATGDQSAIARLKAAYVTTAIAEYFRDQGKDVMMLFDNLTRFAHAQREIGNSTGELPAQGGYPPSVYAMLPKLLERTGNNDKGSITAFYAVLVDSDDTNEPITDKVRGTVDGHVFLNRALQKKQHYPAIDIGLSISRLANRVTGTNTRKAVQRLKRWIAVYNEQEDFINLGQYQKGASLEIDEAIEMHPKIEEFLCQGENEKSTMEETLQKLSELSGIEIPEEEYDEQPVMKI